MNNYNIALFGGRGYVGQEIIKLLDKHPLFFLKKAYSSSAYGKHIENYSKDKSLKFLNLDGNDFELDSIDTVSYTHLRAHETLRYLVCRLLLEKKKK